MEIIIEALARRLPPLKRRKDPVVAAIIGAIVGGFGLALYLRSWLDAGLTVVWVVMFAIFVDAGGSVGLATVAAIYGNYPYARVHASNRRLERGAQPADQQRLPAS
jgi:predicted permease